MFEFNIKMMVVFIIKINLEMDEFEGVDNVIIKTIKAWSTSMIGYEHKTRITVQGLDYSLWHLGDITNLYSSGDQVSIIFESIPLYGHIQRWIHCIGHENLNTLELTL